MKRYKYKAKNPQGKLVKGIVEAVTQKQAVALLKDRQLVVISLQEDKKSFSQLNFVFNRVKATEKTNFTRQFSTMISAGLSVIEALQILENQNTGALRTAITKVKQEIEGGKSLSEGLSDQPKIFDRIYISLVKAGEASGALNKTLKKLAEQMEARQEFVGKVKGALIYPVLILVGMIGVMVFMMVFVIPQLTSIYSDFDAELPFYTKMIMSISDFFVNSWWILLLITLGAYIGLKVGSKNPAIKKKLEILIMATPIWGPIWQQVELTNITRTLSFLTAAGVPIVEGLKLSSQTSTSKIYEEDILKAASLVEKGFPLAQALSQQSHFPDLIPQMVAIGEQTGKTDELLNRISIYYQKESEQKIKNITTAMEPLILILLGVGVLVLIVAIIMPIYNLTSVL